MKLEMKNMICIIRCASSDAFTYKIHMRILYENEPELTVGSAHGYYSVSLSWLLVIDDGVAIEAMP